MKNKIFICRVFRSGMNRPPKVLNPRPLLLSLAQNKSKEIINYLNKKEFSRPIYDLHIQPLFFRDRKIGYERQKIKLTPRDQ
jgi:hypothetical protein